MSECSEHRMYSDSMYLCTQCGELREPQCEHLQSRITTLEGMLDLANRNTRIAEAERDAVLAEMIQAKRALLQIAESDGPEWRCASGIARQALGMGACERCAEMESKP